MVSGLWPVGKNIQDSSYWMVLSDLFMIAADPMAMIFPKSLYVTGQNLFIDFIQSCITQEPSGKGNYGRIQVATILVNSFIHKFTGISPHAISLAKSWPGSEVELSFFTTRQEKKLWSNTGCWTPGELSDLYIHRHLSVRHFLSREFTRQ